MAVVHQGGKGHVAAVGAAPDGHARRIEVALACDPVEQRGDVADSVLTLPAVVEPFIREAIARRAPDVGGDESDPKLVHEIVVE